MTGYHAKTKGDFMTPSVDVGSDYDIMGKGFYFGTEEYASRYGEPSPFKITGKLATKEQWTLALSKYSKLRTDKQRAAAREDLKKEGHVGVWTGEVGVVWDQKALVSNIANTRWKFHTDPEKIKAFQAWLKQQIASLIVGKTEEELWRAYAEQGFKKGAGRAFDDVRMKKLKKRHPEIFTEEHQQSVQDFYRGTKEQFLRSAFARPVAVEKVKLLAGRSFDDLRGVTEQMSLKMSRALTDGLVQGDHPNKIAKALAEEVDISRDRAETVARTEIVRCHAEGQLEALEQLGVDEVGVTVEWTTSGDDAVCPQCEPLEGVVLKVSEAHGMLPRHPNCRCAFIPAGLGEDDDDQKISKKEIEVAVKESQKLGKDADDWGPAEKISKKRPESILNTLTRFAMLLDLNSFCPTGAGGGVDPSCSPGGAGSGSGPHPGNVKVLKALGGSTGAKLVQDQQGKKWVMKTGPGEGQLRNEVDADNAYRAAGVPTPPSHLVETSKGPVKFSEYMEGAQTLDKWESGRSKEEVAGMHQQIAQHLATDALLSNWDVVGLGKDNIMVRDGKAYRVDNGGALKYRAQGSPKGGAFGDKVSELETLRDPHVNKQSAQVFKSATPTGLDSQIHGLLDKRDAILKAVKDPATRATLSNRMDYLAGKVGASPKSATPEGTPAIAPGSIQGPHSIEKALGGVLKDTGYTRGQLRDGLLHDTTMRARVESSLLKSGARPDAIRDVKAVGDSVHLANITAGDTHAVLKEFASTPSYDLHGVTKVTVHSKALPGEALANMGTRSIEVGTTTRPGSYRHELGHVLHAGLGGKSYHGKTGMTEAISSEYQKVMDRVKEHPEGTKAKQSHEWYEEHYGVAGRRSVDNEKENFAEHYRLYHRELYRDQNEGGGGKFLAGYRQRHPGMAKIFDAHYTAALIHEHLKESSSD